MFGKLLIGDKYAAYDKANTQINEQFRKNYHDTCARQQAIKDHLVQQTLAQLPPVKEIALFNPLTHLRMNALLMEQHPEYKSCEAQKSHLIALQRAQRDAMIDNMIPDDGRAVTFVKRLFAECDLI